MTGISSGYVTFRLGDRRYAAPLEQVREVVRLAALERLPGLATPVSGVLELRGSPLPVVDARRRGEVAPTERGDVLVLQRDGDLVGLAVDAVLAVHGPGVAEEAEAPAAGLPAYVGGVIRDPADGRAVLLVDLPTLLSAA